MDDSTVRFLIVMGVLIGIPALLAVIGKVLSIATEDTIRRSLGGLLGPLMVSLWMLTLITSP